MTQKILAVIVGPTAVGKTSLAIKLAKYFKTEIVSADSRQFFREMKSGTAKPTDEELKEIRHHLINSHSIHDEYNAGHFEKDALESLNGIYSKSNIAILCGGSGLYIDLVCKGADPLPEKNEAVRDELSKLYRESGIGALQQKMLSLDPEFYKQIDLNNPHRLIRALEVCITTGKKYSDLRKGEKQKRPFTVVKIGLEDDREKVYKRINDRVDEMMKNGLLEEAKALYEFRQLNSLQTVGYNELFDHIEGKTTYQQAVDLIKQHTRNYAKRQWTWFRKDNEIQWFRPEPFEEIVEFLKEF